MIDKRPQSSVSNILMEQNIYLINSFLESSYLCLINRINIFLF